MSKLHFVFKGIIYIYIIDLKLFVQQKDAPFYESTCSLYELDEKPNFKVFKF